MPALLTPTILYDIIIGLGLGLQVFAPAYIMTEGGPLNSTMFTALYIYKNAFEYNQVGLAAAVSGILFIINATLAIVIFLVFQVLGKLSSRIVADLSPERQTVHALTRSHVFQNDASRSIQPDDGGILSGGFTGGSGVPLFSAVLPSGSHFG
jgi:hypothetical protein